MTAFAGPPRRNTVQPAPTVKSRVYTEGYAAVVVDDVVLPA